MASLPRRVRNFTLRTLHRLPPHGQAVSPLVADDLFEAHRALYRFAGSFAAGRRCLDLGCGTGYGSRMLLDAGASEVLGLDVEERALAFARRRFTRSGLSFEKSDLATFSVQKPFGLAVAINVLPHLESAAGVVRRIASSLTPEGLLVASVPPILDGQTMDLHRTLPRQKSNLYLWDWEDTFKAAFDSLRLFRQMPPSGKSPHLGDSSPASLGAEEYRFEELALADLYDVGFLAAVFVASSPKVNSPMSAMGERETA